MTKKEAKELALELWTYLAEHPECYRKEQVPEELYSRVEELLNECPLCEVSAHCGKCPLEVAGRGCVRDDSPWAKWVNSLIGETEKRRTAAREIVDIVAAWKPR